MRQKLGKGNRMKALSKKKKRLLLIIIAGCLLVLAACYTVFIAPLLEKEQWIYKEAVVERGTLKVGVTESGSLEYGISSVLYDLDLTVDSNDDSEDEDEEDGDEEVVQKYLKIEEVYVAVGQRVESGDLLVKFTEDSVKDVRRLLESALVDASSEYADAQSEYRLSALEAETEYEIGVLEGEYADQIYRNGSQSVANEISVIKIQLQQENAKTASLQEAVTEAQEAYNEVAGTYEIATASYEQAGLGNTVNFMIIQNEYLTARTQYENAKSALLRATQNLEDNASTIASLQKELKSLQSGQKLNQLSVEQTWKESQISGENAQISYQAQLEGLKESLQEAEDDKQKVQEQLEAFEVFVGEDGCLYAAESGIVTEVAYEAGDRLRSTGVMISYATPEEMTISVDVTQEDIVDLAVGDKVDITFTAYEGTAYDGRILSINTTATAANSNTVSYTVVIGVEGDTGMLYGGMTADIIFVTEQKEDVLFVSRKAIVEKDGKSYVYCKTGLGGKELKEVEIGMNNGVDIEIISGLEEGDIIYLASRVSSEEEVEAGEETKDDSASGRADEGGFGAPGGMEMPEGFEMPGGFEMPSGGFGGGRPGGGNMPGGFGMPGGGGMPGGNMTGERGGR